MRGKKPGFPVPSQLRTLLTLNSMPPYREIRPAVAAHSTRTTSSWGCEKGKEKHKSVKDKVVKIACRACQRSKVRCDGARPACNRCRVRHEGCHYDGPGGSTRYQTLRINHDKLKESMEQSQKLLQLLRLRPLPEAMAIFDHLRVGTALGDILDLVAQGEALIALSACEQVAQTSKGIKGGRERQKSC